MNLVLKYHKNDPKTSTHPGLRVINTLSKQNSLSWGPIGMAARGGGRSGAGCGRVPWRLLLVCATAACGVRSAMGDCVAFEADKWSYYTQFADLQAAVPGMCKVCKGSTRGAGCSVRGACPF